MKKAVLALEDGTVFKGRAFAGNGETYGELVFNTSMTGYQEILTDPSYNGQIVTLTYPLIGNYGINRQDVESFKTHAKGLVVGECSRIPSNWRSDLSLPEYLEENNLIGIDNVDTRAITLHIRDKGAMKCILSTHDEDDDTLVQKARESEGLVGRDLSSEVSCKEAYTWPGPHAGWAAFAEIHKDELNTYDDWNVTPSDCTIAVLDCGIKVNQLRMMAKMGFDLRVFPNSASASDILAAKPDGLFISNGPGDPQGVLHVVKQLRELVESGLPTFGICFGHQLLALALGGSTYKLKFGHRGANQPVIDLSTGKVEITSQNHGFCVDKDSFENGTVETTHVNLNDQTSEGLRHTKLPVFSVQYHPEACPGPHDSNYLFERFQQLISTRG